jgi:DNA-binding SARP family transcriptional activator/Flp pilus assembly protein TadD
MSASRLRLLGAFALETPFSPAPVRLGRKAQALLACAAMHGGAGVSRVRLIALLWPDHGDEQARGALRQCLHLLRRAVGTGADLLASDGDRLVLRSHACEVDVHRFEVLAASDDLLALKSAARLYRGDFLDGLDVGADFDRWTATERERLRDLACRVLSRLSEATLDAADHDQAVQLAHQLLATDPVHEGCYRALMRLHARAGLRAKAVQTWNDCREELQRELGVEPGSETASLLSELSAVAAAAVPDRAAQALPTMPFPGTPRVPVVSGPRVGDDPRVVDLNLRGWESFCRCTPEDNLLARAAFEEAVRLAGDHAEVIARVGWTHFMESVSGWTWDHDGAMDQAYRWASRAISCNRSGRSTPHTLMGKVLLRRGQFDEALAQLRTAAALEPHYAWANFHLAEGLMLAGECDKALAAVSRALALDLNDHGMFLTIRGFALWMIGELQAAQMALDSAVTRNPSYFWAQMGLIAVHAERGDLARARAAAETARRLNPRFSVWYAERVLPMRVPEHQRRMSQALRAAGALEEQGQPLVAGSA